MWVLHGGDNMGAGARMMGDTEITSIAVQLAPSAHVTEEMLRVVMDALSIAGIEVTGWVPLEGEADLSHWPRVAQPTFRLIVTGPRHRIANRKIADLNSKIADVLARIRSSLPALPVSINSVARDGVLWFNFRPSDSPEGIRRGIAALGEAMDRDAGALGWDDDTREWVAL